MKPRSIHSSVLNRVPYVITAVGDEVVEDEAVGEIETDKVLFF